MFPFIYRSLGLIQENAVADHPAERPFVVGEWFNRWDLILLPLVLGVLFVFAWASGHVPITISVPRGESISLSPIYLPLYTLKTTLRMLVALGFSLLFTFMYGGLAAKSRRAERVMVPLLDILQSVPILGFLSIIVVWVVSRMPNQQFGLEMAAVFAIFTSQAWNMTFSYYHSLKRLPKPLTQAARVFGLSRWQRFTKLELPYAIPGLVWNTMMSVSGGWFFVVASEAITVSGHQVLLPGVGSYIAEAIAQRNLRAIGWAIFAMFVALMLYDQLVFRPLIAWADKFRSETTAGDEEPRSWMLDLIRRSRLPRRIGRVINEVIAPRIRRFHLPRPQPRLKSIRVKRVVRMSPRLGDAVWVGLLALIGAVTIIFIGRYVFSSVGFFEIGRVFLLGFYTLLRVLVMTLLASLIWLPVGIRIGLDSRLTHRARPIVLFLSAFPANLLFPIAVYVIVRYGLNTQIWLSPLMVLGTQWYILFNVISGASSISNDLREAARNMGLRGWRLWRRLYLPAVLPAFVTGALTAAGGAWNASVVAEIVSWGGRTLTASGVGSYIAEQTTVGNLPRVVLGIAVMSLYVVVMNRILWRPLYRYSAARTEEGS